MPGIFVGIGGIGGNIVAQVRRSLHVKVELAGDTPSAREAASQFKFILLDTWRDGVALGFDASECFDLPEGKDKFEVNAKVDSWYRGLDPTFRSWWPEHQDTGTPLLPGPYSSGAGQLRAKGKLAYRIALSGIGRPPVPGIEEALREIDTVLGPAPGIRTVPVYLCCSLGGGTGSGMVLTLAQHLRQVLPEYCPIVGVFPLASVTELGPGASDSSSVWANTDTALREIDYCQLHAGRPDNKLNPFFQWPGNGNVVSGKQRPFEYVYLFGRDNQSGQSLQEFSEYENLVAEALIAESFSNLIDEGLQNGIRGPHSQFIMALQARPEIGGRPTNYASAAVASLVFPVERIERHLARRFAIKVLDKMLDEDDTVVRAEVEEFVQRNSLHWGGKPDFAAEFDKPVTDTLTGKTKNRPTLQVQLNPDNNEAYAKMGADPSVAYLRQAKKTLDAWAGKEYQTYLAQRSREIIDAYRGPTGIDGLLQKQVIEWLNTGGASALGLAYEAVTELRKTIEEQWSLVSELLEGKEGSTKTGLKKELADLEDAYDQKLQQFQKQFKNGLFGFGGSGKDAKEKFLKQTWRPLQDKTITRQKALMARETYRELSTETQRVQRVLKILLDDAANLRTTLERETETDVGEHGKTGVLDLAVMDHPRLLEYHFREPLELAERQGAEHCAIAVTGRPEEVGGPIPLDTFISEDGSEKDPGVTLIKTGVVVESFEKMINPKTASSMMNRDRYRDQLENAIVSEGVGRLGPQVRDMSIWDALAADCDARQAINMPDNALHTAIKEVQDQRGGAEEAGVPAKDWNRYVLAAFIRCRLFECQKRVRSFWNLNGRMTADYGQPYDFTVLATDKTAYRIAESKYGIKGVLDNTASLMRAGTPKWMHGSDRIVIYNREGVAPLFYINDRELKRMRDATSQKAKEKFLYTDVRFEELLDPVVRPHETAEERSHYAIGLGIYFDIISGNLSGLDGNRSITLRLNGEQHHFNSFKELSAHLKHDKVLADDLAKEIDRRLLADENGDSHQSEVHTAQTKVAGLLRDVAKSGGDQDEAILSLIDRALLTRITYGLLLVDVPA